MLQNLMRLNTLARSFPVLGVAAMLFGAGVEAAQAVQIGDPFTSTSMSISPSDDGIALASSIVGSGVSISNVNFVGGSGPLFSAGFFQDPSEVMGLNEGIILTSGDVNLALGPNNSDSSTGFINTPGDADLDALIPGFSTLDSTVLEFDITSATGDLFIQYSFASEEYNEFVNSNSNDVFGFFFEGTNIALIPGTSTPVAINNVNKNLNSGFYNNNDPSDLGIPTPFHIEYDGFTDVFTAKATGLTPGQTYNLKLAIADAGDRTLDSAVFIKGISSVDPEPQATPEPATVAGLVALGLLGTRLKRKKA
ncbi:PEP-CTERM sorting domain-containing protein [Aphanothece hegewaldii CCALA 016]|uniref:PEP-CTERM sorting domain-containing protein n=1 Tax=Aphanothece hegewaldii CCALA 016 TaxID=2107694 RepID=A0A2T1M2C6_9CHRO|nr:choice-of-anchor L domain-containing protein [Aphanothece hegewaldii]PSF38882.1 PEP-CTERM sorting domain-containing protein [Aphanothece hegewaldii CCALA 016]